MKTILLAGGLGTRLGNITSLNPKPMLEISGRPFLEYLLDYLEYCGVKEVFISISYLKEKVILHFGNCYKTIKINYIIEDDFLGTGGAVLNCFNQISTDEKFLVMNADCFQLINLKKFYQESLSKNVNLSLVLRKMADTKRYGRVEFNDETITSFVEKGLEGEGYINSGCYFIDSKWFKEVRTKMQKKIVSNKKYKLNSSFKSKDYNFEHFPQKFSIEADFFSKICEIEKVSYFLESGYFIDIGTPEDLSRAKSEITSLTF
jgi:D-glycero-alpha-D-manno-heptose 1-phosphate guanylyltransferase